METNNIKTFIKCIPLCVSAVMFSSCNDFLDSTPKAAVTVDKYFKDEAQLEAYLNSYYKTGLPSFDEGGGDGDGTYGADRATDNEQGTDGRYRKDTWTVPQSEGNYIWYFNNIFTMNYFLETAVPRYEAGEISGTPENIRHYIGEAYFFRALDYFYRLKTLGDFPIIKETLPDDQKVLAAAAKRAPRNEVARFILEDLDKAIEMMSNSFAKTRVSKNAALLIKSRVALYEATWEKYHAGTALVPNGPGWPGASKEYNAGYEFPSGSAENEINFFLEQAMDAASQVADALELTPNNQIIRSQPGMAKNPYYDMFACHDPQNYTEVILYRAYSLEQDVVHSFNHYKYSGGNSGYTHQYEQSFLMDNGLPVYATGSGYKGDDYIADTKVGRDWRWKLFMKAPDEAKAVDNIATIEYFPTAPRLYISDAKNATSTGYIRGKGYSLDYNDQLLGKDQTAFVVYRAGEAYLNYIEASYLRKGNIDSKADQYWKALRKRAGVDTDYNKTIAATDVAREAAYDWGAYSHGQLIDATLFNIRRERRCEFIGEGFRYNDLVRWRSLDQLNNYQLEGAKIFGPMRSLFGNNLLYDQADQTRNNVSSPSLSEYLRPQQKNTTNQFYDGFNFYEAHYLNPIAVQHFLNTSDDGKTISTSPIYQNPGWPTIAGATCE